MIKPVTAPLPINRLCRQASCHFDSRLFEDTTPARLGLPLPSHLKSAVQKRKAEFVAGRYCARAALAQLDCNVDVTNGEFVIGSGTHRQPLWPPGYVGSITHTLGYASAAVARTDQVRAIGIDSEMWIEPGSVADLSQQILSTGESHSNYPLFSSSPQRYLTLVFSAKESVFKCLFPLINRFFDFHAAVITPLPSGSSAEGTFGFELLEDLNAEFQTGFSGQGIYTMDDTGVHTAVILKNNGV